MKKWAWLFVGTVTLCAAAWWGAKAAKPQTVTLQTVTLHAAAVEQTVGDAPSTLRLILPETQLPDAPVRVPEIQKTMEAYARDVLTRRLHGFVLTARTTPSGRRSDVAALSR